MAEIDDILNDATADFRRRLLAAFEAGRAVGREEGSSDLRSKLAELIGSDGTARKPATTVTTQMILESQEEERAPRGSVKPAVLSFLRQHSHGLTVDEITKQTGVKYNSVRGSLWKLNKEHEAFKQGDKWFPRPQTVSERNEAPEGASQSADEGDTSSNME